MDNKFHTNLIVSSAPHIVTESDTTRHLYILRLDLEKLTCDRRQFFDAMRLDLELEEQVQALTEKEKLTAKVVREFIIRVEA